MVDFVVYQASLAPPAKPISLQPRAFPSSRIGHRSSWRTSPVKLRRFARMYQATDVCIFIITYLGTNRKHRDLTFVEIALTLLLD